MTLTLDTAQHSPSSNTMGDIFSLLVKIASRHSREYDQNQVDLISSLSQTEDDESLKTHFIHTWNKLTESLFSAPHWFALLMDEQDNPITKK